jgi:pilus assembly protein CpaC
MMRLLLTVLAALGFVWAALNNSRAEEPPAPATVTAPAEMSGENADKPVADAAQASASSSSDPAEEAAPAAAQGPRQFGFKRKDARIVIEAKEEAWVRISDSEGALVFMRTMKPGETYRVPNRGGLLLDSGNAKGLAFQVDGSTAPAPVGMVRRGIALDADALMQGVLARPRATIEAPVAEAPRMPAPVLMADKPASEQPAAEKPVAEKPVAEKVDKPLAEKKPVAEKAVAEKPASESGKLIAEPKDIIAAKKAATIDAPPAVAASLEPPPLEAPAAVPAPVTPAVATAAVATESSASAAAATPVAAKPAEPTEPAGEILTATLPGPLPSAKPAPVEPAAAAAPAVDKADAPTPQMAAVVPPPAPAPKPAVKPVVASTPAATAAAPAAKSDAKPMTLTSTTVPRVAQQVERPSGPITGAAAVTPAGVINSAASRIGLEINKGTLVRLSQPATTVFVADPEIADIQMKTTGLVYIFAKRAGETALFAVDDRERVVLNTTLVVSHNVSRLRQALRAVAPEAEVEVLSVDDSLILTGMVNSPVEAENIRAVAARFAPEKGSIINQIRVLAPNQVNLRVRFAEVSKETLKQFGINWESIARIGGNVLFGVATGRDFINAAGNFPRDGSTNTIIGSYSNGRQDINAAIDALATEGLITVLAEPNLTALNGETASFLAGGEFPIPIAQNGTSSSGSITVEFKTFGVGLAFTPHLLDASRINLRVRPEVSQLSAAGAVQLAGFTIPALTTRRAETTVELGSGQSFVIAGLLQNNTTQDISRVPLLGDLPILGALFRSDRFRRNESELVIIVTPYVVRPVSANRIASPTDGFVAPNDVERILGGVTYRPQLNDRDQQPRTKEGQGLIGPSGFQLD